MDAEGRIDGGGHETWWGVAGSLDDGALPLLTVHGGPGLTHDYLEDLSVLSAVRPVVFYDQFGSGRSERASDPSAYTVEAYVEELGRVREALGLDRVHLLAHSYGGPLALEYLLRHPGSGVASLVLSNTFGSVAGLAAGWQRLLDGLPPATAAALRDPQGAGPEAYGAAIGEFVGRHVLPGPMPESLVRSQSGSSDEVYQRMHGSSWFVPDGEWASWSALDRLADLDLPVLVVGGVRDQCVPELARELAEGIPGARLEVLDAAHLPFAECRDDYVRLVGGFLAEHDG